MKEWQAWAPNAPRSIDSNLVISKNSGGGIDLRCSGQSIGTRQQLQRELKFITTSPTIVPMPYFTAVEYFGAANRDRKGGPIHLMP